jgi:hypothetical protein
MDSWAGESRSSPELRFRRALDRPDSGFFVKIA